MFQTSIRPRVALAVLAVLAMVLAVLSPVGSALPARADTLTVDPSLRTGLSADTAATSCWEIKQLHPTSADGAYWLLTPSMRAPQRFWCDMTTDGGGWVRIGSGREQWGTLYDGKGNADELLQPTPPLTRAVQLGARTVDALLDGGRVDALQDRVRVRRALTADGSAWQEVRFQYVDRDRWNWTMGAEHRVSTWSFDGVAGTGGQTVSFGSNQSTRRVNGSIQTNQGFRWGYAYGTQVTGTNSASTYLWSSTNGAGSALPYAEVYLRPRLMSTDVIFPRIADGGTAREENRAAPNSAALVNPWGVNGTAGSTGTEGNVEVQALEQIGNVMYVGGNFRWVQRDAAGTGRVEQSFLAAFNATTGEYIAGFAPRFNEQVRALKALPDGTLAVGGDFTLANGQPVQGLVALNAASGASVAAWQVRLENNVSPGVVRIRSLALSDNYLYLAGNFTHLSRPDGTGRVYARNAGRVHATTAVPNAWNPELNGTVNDVATSEDGSRAYFAGFFDRSRQDTAFRAAAVLTESGAPLDPVAWNPVWSNTNKNYQRAVDQAADRVWVGGSEHSLFDFSTSTYNRLGGSITKRGGDFQAIEIENGQLFGGCHCNQWNYQDAYTWSNVGTGWTQADAIGWIGQWDASTGRYVPDFTPEFSTRLGSAIWAIEVADDGTVWAGGDITTGRTVSGARWLGGFARWAPRDTTAPGSPSNFRIVSQDATSVSLAWNSAGAGTSGYQVLRDDRVVGTTNGGLSITVPKGGENRFFVRAADAAGNVSASTTVLATGDGNPAPVPVIAYEADGLDVRFDGTGSTDDGAITSYLWDLGDGTVSSDPVVEHSYATTGSYPVRLTVVDDLGAFRSAQETVVITLPAPSDAYGTTVLEDSPFLYWRLAEVTGSMTQDYSANDRPGVYHGSVARGVDGALVDNPDLAAGFDGSTAHVVGAPGTQVTDPGPFSVEVWFRSTSTSGGKLIGFGNAASGLSSSYDRHVYLRNDGRLTFGVWTGAQNVATSPLAYNDGQWHHVVATQGAAGMSLYVDGDLVATNPQTDAQNFTGYWRVGGDRVWDGASSPWLAGTLDEAAVYATALSTERIMAHYLAGRQELPANQLPTASFTASVNGLSVTLDASASTDPDGSIVTYSWDLGDGTTADGMTATHTYPAEGTYTVTLTVLDDRGGTHSVAKDVNVWTPTDPVVATVVERDAAWSWYYATDAPDPAWKTGGADLSAWQVGPAPLGFGFDAATDIDIDGPTSDRPRAAYFVREFEVADADRVVKLVLDTIADDGVMVHVNGVEVVRHNMHEGEITHTTFAASARRREVALADPVVVEVPLELLVDGTNVIAAQTHLNFRNTRDLSFELDAVMTTN